MFLFDSYARRTERGRQPGRLVIAWMFIVFWIGKKRQVSLLAPLLWAAPTSSSPLSSVQKGRSERRRQKQEEGHSQQRQRHIALQPRLELDLDVEIQPQLQAHRLGLGQPGDHRGPAQPARLRQLLLLLPVAAAAAPARVDRRDVRGGVVELEKGSGST